MRSNTTRLWSPFLRIGAILAFAGIVVYYVSSEVHPSREDPGDWSRTIQEYAESDAWIAVHLFQFIGLFLVLLGLAILAESLRREYRGTVIEAVAFLALVTIIVTASVFVILQGIDGISLKAMVDAWANAPAEEKATAFRISESVRWIEVGINSIFRILLAMTLFLIGTALALTFNRPNPFRGARVLGSVAIVIGASMALRGYAVAYTGFSAQNPLYSQTAVFVIIFLLWMIAIGVAMWRRKELLPPS